MQQVAICMSRSTPAAAQGEHQQHQDPVNPHHSSNSSKSLLDSRQVLLRCFSSLANCRGSTEAVETDAALDFVQLSAPILQTLWRYHHSFSVRQGACRLCCRDEDGRCIAADQTS